MGLEGAERAGDSVCELEGGRERARERQRGDWEVVTPTTIDFPSHRTKIWI